MDIGNVFSQRHASSAPVRFGGIYANFNPDNVDAYLKGFHKNPKEHTLKPFATRIFRELPTTLAVSKLIGQSPADIHILGCSDGSEAYAYAITLKESMGKKAQGNVKITGIDYTPYLVELAKTGYLVCTDQEKIWANDTQRAPHNPLAQNGWNQYLEASEAPDNFDALVKQYPNLSQITRDPVSNIAIGNGMNWYKIRPHGLPDIHFEVADMRDYVKRAPAGSKRQVYVAANALGYIAQQYGPKGFVRVLQDIQNNNRGKETYVVVGQVEHQVFKQAPQLVEFMKALGYEPVSQEQLKSLGATQIDKAYGNIWKVNTTIPVKLTFDS